jgi:hypothetical protein
MCPLCITAGTLYLAGVSTGSAGGLAAVAVKMMRGRKGSGKKRPDRSPNPASSYAEDGVSFRVANIKCQETIDAAAQP